MILTNQKLQQSRNKKQETETTKSMELVVPYHASRILANAFGRGFVLVFNRIHTIIKTHLINWT